MNQLSSPDALPEIDTMDFDAVVLRAAVPVFVDFSTAWCGPCRSLAPMLRAIAGEHAERVAVVIVDGDRSADLTARYRIRGFPTVIAFVGGREVCRQVGLPSRGRLLDMIDCALRADSAQSGRRRSESL